MRKLQQCISRWALVSSCMLVALLTTACDSLGVSANMGVMLDSMGKSVPVAYAKDCYSLNGKNYVECEVEYSQCSVPAVEAAFGHLVGPEVEYTASTGWSQLPPVERYLLAEDGYEIVRAEDFDYSKAELVKPGDVYNPDYHGVPEAYTCRFDPLTADFCTRSVYCAPVNFVPEKRTVGNYVRTPLVAAVSWGADVPLTAVSNTSLYSLFGVFFVLSLLVP